jgi:hypothetical protein
MIRQVKRESSIVRAIFIARLMPNPCLNSELLRMFGCELRPITALLAVEEGLLLHLREHPRQAREPRPIFGPIGPLHFVESHSMNALLGHRSRARVLWSTLWLPRGRTTRTMIQVPNTKTTMTTVMRAMAVLMKVILKIRLDERGGDWLRASENPSAVCPKMAPAYVCAIGWRRLRRIKPRNLPRRA